MIQFENVINYNYHDTSEVVFVIYPKKWYNILEKGIEWTSTKKAVCQIVKGILKYRNF